MFSFNPATSAAAVQTAVETLRAEGDTPAAIGRVEGVNITVAAATGTANLSTGEKAMPDARFEVGSQTKMMTATIVLQLEAEGRIDLDAPAAHYLDAAMIAGIANADTATVRELLSMRSGIANYTEITTADGTTAFVQQLLDNPDKSFGSADALDLVRNVPAGAAPGEFSYSNTNYTLLGLIIENISGEPLAAAFEQRVFTPAGMTHSDLAGATAPGDGLHGYAEGAGGEVVDTTFAKWDKFAEGGVVSTTGDMIRFIRALLVDGALLPAAQLAEMKNFATIAASPELVFKFGLGLVEFEIPGAGKFIGLNGGTLGHESNTYISVDSGTVVSLDVNKAGTAANGDAAALLLLGALAANPDWRPITAFDALSDVMRIETASAAAARIGAGDSFEASFGGVTLTLPLATRSVTSANMRFEDGSVLIIGDNTAGTARDDAANRIDIPKQFGSAAGKDNQVLGFGGDDVIRGGNGNDRMSGGHGHDRVSGGAGADRLSGNAGNDILTGGTGQDRMAGGAGHDVFDFNRIRESGAAAGQRDLIIDFAHGQDTIDLGDIDANSTRPEDQRFSFIGDALFSGRAGELRAVAARELGWTIIEGDSNGDGQADFSIDVRGNIVLGAGDFIL